MMKFVVLACLAAAVSAGFAPASYSAPLSYSNVYRSAPLSYSRIAGAPLAAGPISGGTQLAYSAPLGLNGYSSQLGLNGYSSPLAYSAASPLTYSSAAPLAYSNAPLAYSGYSAAAPLAYSGSPLAYQGVAPLAYSASPLGYSRYSQYNTPYLNNGLVRSYNNNYLY